MDVLLAPVAVGYVMIWCVGMCLQASILRELMEAGQVPKTARNRSLLFLKNIVTGRYKELEDDGLSTRCMFFKVCLVLLLLGMVFLAFAIGNR